MENTPLKDLTSRYVQSSKTITDPKEARELLYEVRGFVMEQWSKLDAAQMDTLHEVAKVLSRIASKKKKYVAVKKSKPVKKRKSLKK